ncbi:MAG: biotin-dependent carboxyltransferase family protein [Candidatus Methylomirabilia bacterium]
MDIIEVLDGGLFTTVQDLGRYGYQRYGVPVSGAMDRFALRAANILVGNQEGAAGLEITLVGPRLRFVADTVIAITGADLDPRLDDEPVAMWRAVAASQGSILSFPAIRDGMRAYLAIAGGVDVPEILGSRSTYTRCRLGMAESRPLARGDRIATSWENPAARVEGRRLPQPDVASYGHHHALRVVLGPQDDAFTPEGIQTFLSFTYTVSPQSDRVGYRFQGPRIQHKSGHDIVSDGSPPGGVQVPGGGLPIVLLADRGTTGGYTKIATVISADLGRLAQAIPGDTVSFRSTTVEEAHEALKRQEARLQQLKNGALAVFTSRRFRARVNDHAYDVITGLEEAVSRPPGEAVAGPVRKVVRTTVDGETYRFEVEVQG